MNTNSVHVFALKSGQMLPNEAFNPGLVGRDEGNHAHQGPRTPDHGSPYQELRAPMPPLESEWSDRPYSPEV
jgi:hypothetical protein